MHACEVRLCESGRGRTPSLWTRFSVPLTRLSVPLARFSVPLTRASVPFFSTLSTILRTLKTAFSADEPRHYVQLKQLNDLSLGSAKGLIGYTYDGAVASARSLLCRMHAAPCTRTRTCNVHRRGSLGACRRLVHGLPVGPRCRAAHVGTRAQGRAQATSCRLSLREASTSSATDAPTRLSPCIGRFVRRGAARVPQCEHSGRAQTSCGVPATAKVGDLCVFAFSGPSSFSRIGGRDAPAGPAAYGVSVSLPT